MSITAALPNDPAWLKRAFSDLGLAEIDGPRSAPRITQMYRAAHAAHPENLDDSVYAWCSAAMNCWVSEANYRPTYSLMARSWLSWGKPVDLHKRIPRGAIGVIPRGNSSTQGHVFLILDDDGQMLTTLGANQSKIGTGGAVTISHVRKSALLGARWPNTPANSGTIQSLIGSTVSEGVAHGAGEGASYLEKALPPDAITEGLTQAQELAQQAAAYLRWAQIAFVIIGALIVAYGIARYVRQWLRPAPDPFIESPADQLTRSAFADDLIPTAPARRRKPARRKGKRRV